MVLQIQTKKLYHDSSGVDQSARGLFVFPANTNIKQPPVSLQRPEYQLSLHLWSIIYTKEYRLTQSYFEVEGKEGSIVTERKGKTAELLAW